MQEDFSFKRLKPYIFPRIDLEKDGDDITWLREVCEMFLLNESFRCYKTIRERLRKRLGVRVSDSYDPSRIDKRLIREGTPTLLGVWHVSSPTHPLFWNADNMIIKIGAEISRPGSSLKEITSSRIAEIMNPSEKPDKWHVEEVEHILELIKHIGKFYNDSKPSEGRNGISWIELSGKHICDEYKNYKGLEKAMERFFEEKNQ